MRKKIIQIHKPANIDGLIPGVKGQRAFPTRSFRKTDPFLMLDHIGPQKVGIDYFLDGENHAHPHRGFETLTFMFEGRMEHIDSLGNQVDLSSGSVQRMNAGSGIIHGGNFASDAETERFHEVQLWINNPASEKMSTPEIHNVLHNEIPSQENGQHRLRLITGTLNNLTGPIQTITPTQIGHLIAKGEGKTEITDFETGFETMVYVLEGTVSIEGKMIAEYNLGEMSLEGDRMEIETQGKAELLIMAGKPINEPVVFGGPFVMNTQEEIQQAKIDFANGLFGTIK